MSEAVLFTLHFKWLTRPSNEITIIVRIRARVAFPDPNLKVDKIPSITSHIDVRLSTINLNPALRKRKVARTQARIVFLTPPLWMRFTHENPRFLWCMAH